MKPHQPTHPSAPIPPIHIREFDPRQHQDQVIALWQQVFAYQAPHNSPALAIAKKLAVADGLLFVATDGASVVGTVMAGYDGHRGWIYSLAVHPDKRKRGIGTALLRHAEQKLAALGCVKINLQVLEDNAAAAAFYTANGYSTEKRINLGKLLPQNF